MVWCCVHFISLTGGLREVSPCGVRAYLERGQALYKVLDGELEVSHCFSEPPSSWSILACETGGNTPMTVGPSIFRINLEGSAPEAVTDGKAVIGIVVAKQNERCVALRPHAPSISRVELPLPVASGSFAAMRFCNAPTFRARAAWSPMPRRRGGNPLNQPWHLPVLLDLASAIQRQMPTCRGRVRTLPAATGSRPGRKPDLHTRAECPELTEASCYPSLRGQHAGPPFPTAHQPVQSRLLQCFQNHRDLCASDFRY